MIDPEIKKKNREKFLELLYHEVSGNIRYDASLVNLGNKLGLEEEELQNIASFLKEKGLVSWTAMGHISITAEGIEKVEAALVPEETSHVIVDEEKSVTEINTVKKKEPLKNPWFNYFIIPLAVTVFGGVIVGLILLSIQHFWPDGYTPDKKLDLASNQMQKNTESIASDTTNNTNDSIKPLFNGNENLNIEQENLGKDAVDKVEKGNKSTTKNPEKAILLKTDNLAIPGRTTKPSKEKKIMSFYLDVNIL